ncbi:MAG: isoprenylcysteine carboxylmethyltransferase family protein [Bacilli bacterium]|nr:isoprenylcysteine carboxylmethyltransferase family protein [Bacilli bacterium]
MNMKLLLEALLKFSLGIILVGLLIFLPAGTIHYWNGILLMCILFVPMFIAGIIMLIKSPRLLESRLNLNEKEQTQKEVVKLSGLMFCLGFIVAGLNYRYSWIELPNIVVYISSIIFIISYILYGEVLKENAYLARTIEVSNNQKLIDTGLYKIVRHPMYTVTLLLFLSMPLILNSLLSFIIFLMYPFIIIKRINNEEKVLESKLKGYKEYKRKVKYKLIPFVW